MSTAVVRDDGLFAYDFGDHPLDPVRVELALALAGELGVLDRPGVTLLPGRAATDAELTTVHDPAYLAAVRAAPDDPYWSGRGLNTPDNPTFPGMHDAAAYVAGASLVAAAALVDGTATRAVQLAGGLHHAMPDRAAGFCVYNDVAVAIHALRAGGLRRVAYLDVDVHHGDGVQAAFADEPDVLTISLHQSPRTLFPGTGEPTETGGPHARGSAVNVALPPGTGDDGWLRALFAVVPPLLRAFAPDVLVTQCGADAHRLDPLADLRLTVDGQRAAYLAMRSWADELAAGRWLAVGGGGYAHVAVVPRAWTHLLAVATGAPIEPARLTPPAWRALAARRRPGVPPPLRMTDDAPAAYRPWPADPADPVDRAIAATRAAVFPAHGLDPGPAGPGSAAAAG
ncbi:acetoin utilization protein AcuC [Pilimelia anulata]|uniref:Acetoin utilization protein AcuC n=1 Tax=Pilimelia anulata TaxID=53371 RepID=A0A8J3B1S0_9ACTN|nr:acetoin utilization protein AcuC [Pilimelia anulata]GGJ77575.1 acetoin utilization protein AcuC [Pilimelia anulata]